MVVSCFGARKRNEAWNPGNFGCRGLLLCAEFIRPCVGERQPLGPIRKRVFVPVSAVEQQHTLVLADQALCQRLAPRGEHGPAFGAEQKSIVMRGVLDGLQDRLLRNRDRGTAAVAHGAEARASVPRLGPVEARSLDRKR